MDDIAYLRARSQQADLKLLPTTLGVALPSRLVLAGQPGHGSLHPTGMVGVTLTSIGGETRVLGEPGSPVGNDWVLPMDGSRPGLTATAGLEWRPAPRLALFAEYRYQDLRFQVDGERGGFFGPTWHYAASGRFVDQRLVLGLSLAYGSDAAGADAGAPAAAIAH